MPGFGGGKAALALGGKLPAMPLWVDFDICVPVHLEDSYLAACQALRIRL